MRSKPIISATAILAGVMLSGRIALGTPAIPQLVLTENSSTSLTANLTGTAITVSVKPTTMSDQWVLTFSEPVTGSAAWLEPGNPNSPFLADLSNLILPVFDFPDQLVVTSDTTPFPGAMSNGSPDITDFTLNGGPMFVTFNDNGDAVPDATSTLPLLSLSLAGLGMLAKRLKA